MVTAAAVDRALLHVADALAPSCADGSDAHAGTPERAAAAWWSSCESAFLFASGFVRFDPLLGGAFRGGVDATGPTLLLRAIQRCGGLHGRLERQWQSSTMYCTDREVQL